MAQGTFHAYPVGTAAEGFIALRSLPVNAAGGAGVTLKGVLCASRPGPLRWSSGGAGVRGQSESAQGAFSEDEGNPSALNGGSVLPGVG